MANTITCPYCGQKFTEANFPVDRPGACPACGGQVSAADVQNRFPGAQASDRLQFSTRKMFGVVTMVCVLLGIIVVLILPAIQFAGRGLIEMVVSTISRTLGCHSTITTMFTIACHSLRRIHARVG